MVATPWATVTDVAELTGVTVTEPQRRQAVATLELHIGLIEAVERTDVSDRDRYFLKLATCYQAAWLADQPDAFVRSDISAAADGGQSVAFKADGLTLAPLARKAVKRLSWRGVRTIGTAPNRRVVNINSDEYEDTLNWKAV